MVPNVPSILSTLKYDKNEQEDNFIRTCFFHDFIIWD
jgi:hypothetical protein